MQVVTRPVAASLRLVDPNAAKTNRMLSSVQVCSAVGARTQGTLSSRVLPQVQGVQAGCRCPSWMQHLGVVR
jgi:hypothetical protein